jgi:hypothetical protein
MQMICGNLSYRKKPFEHRFNLIPFHRSQIYKESQTSIFIKLDVQKITLSLAIAFKIHDWNLTPTTGLPFSESLPFEVWLQVNQNLLPEFTFI